MFYKVTTVTRLPGYEIREDSGGAECIGTSALREECMGPSLLCKKVISLVSKTSMCPSHFTRQRIHFIQGAALPIPIIRRRSPNQHKRKLLFRCRWPTSIGAVARASIHSTKRRSPNIRGEGPTAANAGSSKAGS